MLELSPGEVDNSRNTSSQQKSTPSMNNFVVTNPIFYPNWPLHIGHAMTLIISEVIANYQRLIEWREVRVTWGTDENWQKLLEAAEKVGLSLEDFLAKMSWNHKATIEEMWIKFTDFIRTTENRHQKTVTEVLTKCFDKWDIYLWNYEWRYCTWCEAFKRDAELVAWKCIDHDREPDLINQENYFFRLSKYQTWLEEFYESNLDFIKPRKNAEEIKAFIEWWLEDFSISRKWSEVWIPMPFDENHMTYIWFDALFNYYTTAKQSRWADNNNVDFSDESEVSFPPNVQVIWKDILRFHAIYWPAMLASYFDLWEEGDDGKLHYKDEDKSSLPDTILTTWMLKVEWQKIAKSLGNAISPTDVINEFWKDLLVNYLLSFSIWSDANYSRSDAIESYNANLANNLWNLFSRTMTLYKKIPYELIWEQSSYNDQDISKLIQGLEISYKKAMEEYDLKEALTLCYDATSRLNEYFHEQKPWVIIKEDIRKTWRILSDILFSLKKISVFMEPFFPEKMIELRSMSSSSDNWKIKPLFKRI